MIDKTMCEVLWQNISDFYVNLRVEVAAVSRNRYGVEKNCWYSYNIDKCNKMLCLSSRNMIDKTMCEVLWRTISDFYVNLRVEVGKHPQVILAMYLILDKNNERPDWMTDLKHTDSAWQKDACKRNLCYIYSFVWFWNIVDH